MSSVINEAKKGTRVAVVVSAMGKTTDVLLSTAKNASMGKLENRDLDDILSMGERTSIRIFATALRTNGAESCYFDPIENNWPIIPIRHSKTLIPYSKTASRTSDNASCPLCRKASYLLLLGSWAKPKMAELPPLAEAEATQPLSPS